MDITTKEWLCRHQVNNYQRPRPRPHGGVGGYTAETRVTNRGQDNPGGGHEPGEEGSQGGESRDDAYGQGPEARPQCRSKFCYRSVNKCCSTLTFPTCIICSEEISLQSSLEEVGRENHRITKCHMFCIEKNKCAGFRFHNKLSVSL